MLRRSSRQLAGPCAASRPASGARAAATPADRARGGTAPLPARIAASRRLGTTSASPPRSVLAARPSRAATGAVRATPRSSSSSGATASPASRSSTASAPPRSYRSPPPRSRALKWHERWKGNHFSPAFASGAFSTSSTRVNSTLIIYLTLSAMFLRVTSSNSVSYFFFAKLETFWKSSSSCFEFTIVSETPFLPKRPERPVLWM